MVYIATQTKVLFQKQRQIFSIQWYDIISKNGATWTPTGGEVGDKKTHQ